MLLLFYEKSDDIKRKHENEAEKWVKDGEVRDWGGE